MAALLVTMALLAQAPACSALTLMEQLDRFADAKPIPLVVAGYGMQTKASVPSADTSGKGWLPALQAIARAVSRPDDDARASWYIQDTYIPYRFGSLWTLAADQMWQLDLDLSGADMYSATNREDLVQWLVRTMDGAQLAKGGAAGLGWKDLKPDQQAILSAIVRDPLPVRVRQGKGEKDGWVRRESPRGTEWLHGSTLRFRVQFRDMGVAGGDGSFSSFDTPSASEAPVPTPETASDSIPGTSLRYRRAVPAKLKPGDLNFEATALNAPIGLRGVTTLKDVIAAAAKATHAPLLLSPEFDAMPVFIGDPALRSGDVLRALTFGMQGAWRKIGGAWLLAWDKIGRGAVTQWENESLRALRRELNAAKNATQNKDWPRQVLDRLPPDPDDALAPTREQAEILAAPGRDHPDTGTYYPPTLAFTALTPRQQAAFRKEFGYAEDQWQRTTFEGVKVEVTLSAPGVGESGLSSAGAILFLDAPTSAAEAAARQTGGNGSGAAVPAEDSIVLPEQMRAVAAPMLLRAEWPRLIEQMRRKGLNTLYVPVLWDGQTLFPSRYFPQPDAFHGHDVLAEILKAAKPAGIAVVGVLNTLAWRNPGGSAVHWLRKRPELVDVDILGRTRSAWATPENLPGPGAVGSDWAEDPAGWADDVQPDNPAVREKLLGLVSELRRYPALAGVALDHWMRLAGRDYEFPFPPLGYTVAERAAALDKTGRDPADIGALVTGDQPLVSWFPDPWEPDPGQELRAHDAFAAATYDADAALASDMRKALRQTWPNDVELFSPPRARLLPDGSQAAKITARMERPLPTADAVISSFPAPGKPGQYRWLPAPRMTTDPAANDERLARAANRIQRLAAPPEEGQKPLSGVVLDFTTAPDLLWPCLRLLANQSQTPALPAIAAHCPSPAAAARSSRLQVLRVVNAVAWLGDGADAADAGVLIEVRVGGFGIAGPLHVPVGVAHVPRARVVACGRMRVNPRVLHEHAARDILLDL
jgi:hypothetical protein